MYISEIILNLSLQIPTAEISNFIEELEKDKRFHPSVIGIILLLFMLSVAFFISHMESITYFDSVYACFITYSTIGFGDIDIYVSQFFVMIFALFFENYKRDHPYIFSETLTHYRCEISINTVLTRHQQNWPFSRPTHPSSPLLTYYMDGP